MNQHWWTLPGPEAFLERVSNALQEGVSVVVRMPEFAPRGLVRELRRAEALVWNELSIAGELMPAERLIEKYHPDANPGSRRDLRAVLEVPKLRGMTVLLDAEDGGEWWPEWSQFLADYTERSRDIEPWERATFCTVLEGPGCFALPEENASLRVFQWRGVITDLDMRLYVARQLRDSTHTLLERDVVAAVISELAGYDLALADHLLALPLADLFEPQEPLKAFAEDRHWQGRETGGDEHAWACGQLDYTERGALPHAALEAITGDKAAVAARVWKGQMSVLFPLLEQQRRLLISRHSHRLIVPYELKDGRVVNDRRDMELAHILYQLRNDGAQPPASYMKGLQELVDMRNALAHFDVVTPGKLLSPDLHKVLRTK